MKKTCLLFGLLALTLVGCDKKETPPRTDAHADAYTDVDNTRTNIRDRQDTLTPGDQEEDDFDLTITQNIRKELIDQRNLSSNGKNVKIITIDGAVTLRGVVENPEEKRRIEGIAKNVHNVRNVDNQLDVKNQH